MKTVLHSKADRLSLKTQANTLLTSALLTSSLLVGCQSMPTGSSTTTAMSTINKTPSAAKTILADALQKQRRQSFAYNSNIEVSNDKQFTNIDGQQLIATNDIDSYCEDTHDQAYADLSIQAETAGSDIAAITFDSQREQLKQSYLECSQAYQAWESNQDNSYYDDYYESEEDVDSAYSEYDDEYVIIESIEEDSAVEKPIAIESVGNAGATIIETNRITVNAIKATDEDSTVEDNSNSEDAYVSPYYQQLFDNYDDKSSVLDIRKAQLIEAYLLKPLSINAQGVYQPLAGKFTMLASTQYKVRNNQTSVNQPIYIDFKTGNLYLWADNFAMLNSELLDDKLGLKWQNKWLRLAIDDGTLPKGFGRAVIKAHFDATDRVYEQAAVSQFDFIAPNSLMSLSPKLPTQQLTTMLQSKQVIRRVQANGSYEQSRMDYLRNFYNLISKQYPELIDETIDVESPSSTFAADSLNSENIAKKLLAVINKIITSDDSTEFEAKEDDFPLQELYGFDQRGKLQWQHWRNQELETQAGPNQPNDDITLDVLQQYSSIRTQDVAFPNLPSTMQIPNVNNSIDIRAYSSELAQYYRDGNGTAQGKMLFNMLSMYQDQSEDEDLEMVIVEDTDDDNTDAASETSSDDVIVYE